MEKEREREMQSEDACPAVSNGAPIIYSYTGRVVLFFPSLDIISFLENATFCSARLLHGFLSVSVDLDCGSSNVSATRHGESLFSPI